MSLKDNAPNVKPLDGKSGAASISDAQLHGEDARNAPKSDRELSGDFPGWKAGKLPGGKK